jgi:hypothetical protein
MSISRTAATKNLALDAAYDRGTGMKLKIYAGSVPANADASIGGATLLGTLTLANTPFSAASSGVKTAGAIASDTDADATGTASFFRLTKSDDTVVAQGTVSAAGGGGDAIINSTSVVIHTTISCSALSFTAG